MSGLIRTYHPRSGNLVRKDRTTVPVTSGRPTGAAYVRYEDLYINGDTLQQTLNRCTGNRIVTFPEGDFVFRDFANGYVDGIRLGSGGATGCRGLVGSGRGTVFKMAAGSSTKQTQGNTTTGTNPCMLITTGNVTSPVLQNFTLLGTDQGHFYNGIQVGTSPDALVDGLYLKGASPGFANYPPGETFGISLWRSPRAYVRNVEVDGRNEAGTRVSASPIGWNTTTDALIEDSYLHHAVAGMLTFWETTNITSRNVRVEYNGSGGGKLSGTGINHENSGGVIRHYNPSILIDRASGNSGLHMSLQNAHQNEPDVQVIEPIFDAGPTAGCFSLMVSNNYPGGAQQQTSMPTIVKGGVTLAWLDSAITTSGANPATKAVRYH